MASSAMATAGKSEKTTTHVTFVCQKCTRPVKLNRSLQAKALVGIAQNVEQKLSIEWSYSGQPDTPSTEPEDKRVEDAVTEDTSDGGNDVDQPLPIPRGSPHVLRKKLSRSSLETVSVIYDSLSPSHPEKKSTLKQIQIASETFKMLSTHTDFDHPLCYECPEAVLDSYEQQIQDMEEAKGNYDRLATKLQTQVDSYKSEMTGLDLELESLHREENMLKDKLLSAESKKKQTAVDMVLQKEREACLKMEEQAYWKEFNEHQHRMLVFKDDQMSMQYQLQYTTEQLTRLKKTNVLNCVFHIWHNGHFGTINGLRLGRLQTVPVEWTEINAAWGQTAFLLSTLARLSGITFERFNLVPYGNQSFLEDMESKKRILPLYSSAGLRLFTDSKFDSAMVAFLDCLGQLKQHIEQSSKPHFLLPYVIEKDKIGDSGKEVFSVKTQFNTPERWTKALKFVLTDLRWALTWIAANSVPATLQE